MRIDDARRWSFSRSCSRVRQRPPRTIRPAPSRWWCPIRPAAASTRWRASSPKSCPAALGQQVIVDNRGGGSGLVGTRAVIRSAPDGYTLFLGHTGSISINPILYANAGFDPRKDFTAIGLIASMPVALIAHPSFPAKTIGEVIALAKKEAGKLNIGTSAVGTGGYLSAELFKSIAGVDATIVPYKGTARRDERSARRPCAGRVRRAAAGARQSSRPARCAPSRCSSDTRFSLLPDMPTVARVRPAGIRVRAALRPARARRHAAPDRRQAQCRDAQAGRHRRGEEAHPFRRRRSADLDARTNTPPTSTRKRRKWGALIRKLNLKVE